MFFFHTHTLLVSPSDYGKSPTRQLHSTPIAASGSGHTGNYSQLIKAVVNMQVRLTSGARMQLTLHATRRTPHCVSRLVQATPATSVKARHAPSRHCRNVRGETYHYGHTTTAMHEYRVHPPPPAASLQMPSMPNKYHVTKLNVSPDSLT